mmetsp:Transcript_42415/g.113172  ORF Transcript_42415/g.113172 Transcript_42415/m.113172 type:complete len:224 (+) Transcript_42415:2726-3397(+)
MTSPRSATRLFLLFESVEGRRAMVDSAAFSSIFTFCSSDLARSASQSTAAVLAARLRSLRADGLRCLGEVEGPLSDPLLNLVLLGLDKDDVPDGPLSPFTCPLDLLRSVTICLILLASMAILEDGSKSATLSRRPAAALNSEICALATVSESELELSAGMARSWTGGVLAIVGIMSRGAPLRMGSPFGLARWARAMGSRDRLTRHGFEIHTLVLLATYACRSR